jgi:hypothetical protein
MVHLKSVQNLLLHFFRLRGEAFVQLGNNPKDGHRSPKMDIRFAERDRTFVAPGVDGLIKLWETMTCQ